MMIMMSTTAVALLIPLLVMAAIMLLSSRSMTDREKTSPFECGFDPKNSARIPFSMRFFLLAIIFVVFDIEIVLLMPLPIISPLSNQATLVSIVFILILLVGLLHEWNEGSLNWTS